MEDAFQADIGAIARLPAVPAILEVICRTTGMGFAAVARVTSDRWIACEVLDEIAFGLKPGSELKVETTICNEIRQCGEAVIIDHVAEDAVYRTHHTPALYGFQSYISMPIFLGDGKFFGTLCAIDPKPARLKNPRVIGMFKLFADLIAAQLDADERNSARETRYDAQSVAYASSQFDLASSRSDFASSQADLLDARNTSDLREEFIAVLGHDLRNPLASIVGGMRLLHKEITSEKGKTVFHMMQGSVDRMAGLIDNVMDFARGRLGGGLTLNREEHDLQPIFTHVVDEILMAWPQRKIDVTFDLLRPVTCDRVRMAQLLSNLLSNAITHGSGDVVRVRASTDRDSFVLSVANEGEEIPRASLPLLFQPFARAKSHKKQEGLGLGLYIAAEIARAHGGMLSAESSPAETCFTFRMPLRP